MVDWDNFKRRHLQGQSISVKTIGKWKGYVNELDRNGMYREDRYNCFFPLGHYKSNEDLARKMHEVLEEIKKYDLEVDQNKKEITGETKNPEGQPTSPVPGSSRER